MNFTAVCKNKLVDVLSVDVRVSMLWYEWTCAKYLDAARLTLSSISDTLDPRLGQNDTSPAKVGQIAWAEETSNLIWVLSAISRRKGERLFQS